MSTEYEELKRKYDTLLSLTINVRNHQNIYFKNRNPQNLQNSKAHESKLDAFIDAEINPKLGI